VVTVYIGIGSNIEPGKHIAKGLELLSQAFPSIIFSPQFESEAIGFKGDNFINLVARFDVAGEINEQKEGVLESLDKLILQLKAIENQLGRKRSDQKFSARNIDIDILLYGELVIASPIELPRSEILENAYVLWPLAELAPTLVHPGSNKTYTEFWMEFDKSSQKLTPVVA